MSFADVLCCHETESFGFRIGGDELRGSRRCNKGLWMGVVVHGETDFWRGGDVETMADMFTLFSETLIRGHWHSRTPAAVESSTQRRCFRV